MRLPRVDDWHAGGFEWLRIAVAPIRPLGCGDRRDVTISRADVVPGGYGANSTAQLCASSEINCIDAHKEYVAFSHRFGSMELSLTHRARFEV
jgi:hypothetical protein